ncbi:MAG: hypothetical protein HY286_06535 [Planctomycetes bacterium]|nr:hypothetical protein [Planctomycetota bacterium]
MKFAVRIATLFLVAMISPGCTSTPISASDERARSEIEAAIAASVEATRSQDINAYMATIPDDLIIRDETGATITRDQQRTNTLRDWSIIPRTLSIRVVVDTIHVDGNNATVFTSQRWERLMFQRDGRTTDTVLTTQKHKESWRKTPRGWFVYEIDELGGEVFVNGKPYRQ